MTVIISRNNPLICRGIKTLKLIKSAECKIFLFQYSGFCLGSCLQFPLRKYYYVNQSVTWPDAQQFCREHYTDLATFESLDDIKRLQPTISYSWAWIGLWDDPNAWQTVMGNESNSWRWSATRETSKTGYQSWATGEPNFIEGKETCVTIYAGKWYDKSCNMENSFLQQHLISLWNQ
uniref:C-type lectin domain-containing protein n=1 Tax=Xiphophorus couchianus TaxID=32473 RepID=A0A3B5LT88_9TELE